MLQSRRTFAGFQLGSARDKVVKVRDLGGRAGRARRRRGYPTKLGQPSRDRQFVSGLGKLVHERGFHFIDRRGRELVRHGDVAPLARGLRDLG